MKKLSVVLLSLVTAFSCSSDQSTADAFDGEVILSGKIENPREGLILLEEFTDEGVVVRDTISLDAQSSFELPVAIKEPTFFSFNLYGERQITLALFASDINLTVDASEGGDYTVEGSTDTEYVKQIDDVMQRYQETINELNTEYYEAMSQKDEEQMKAIQARGLASDKAKNDELVKVIKDMDGSFSAIYALQHLNTREYFGFLDTLSADLVKNYPNSKYTIRLREQIDNMRALSFGQVAPEIALPNPEGDTLRLSDYRGSYVMIDFWAAWCRPCRAENPNVVRLYEKYHDKGFEVFGVSLDRGKPEWVKAIADDGLTWPQVSDLQYFNSQAAATYKVDAIPATFLLDPEGKIIAKDLRGPALEAKLAELFGE